MFLQFYAIYFTLFLVFLVFYLISFFTNPFSAVCTLYLKYISTLGEIVDCKATHTCRKVKNRKIFVNKADLSSKFRL